MALEKIQKANDIKELTEEELKELSDEIRRFLIEKISVTGGHLASNLGVVELTMALHKVLHFPEDKLIWDVGHQSYTHKLLTGRKEGFDSLREKKANVMRLIQDTVQLQSQQGLVMWPQESFNRSIITLYL